MTHSNDVNDDQEKISTVVKIIMVLLLGCSAMSFWLRNNDDLLSRHVSGEFKVIKGHLRSSIQKKIMR